jgi:hypothetical protein
LRDPRDAYHDTVAVGTRSGARRDVVCYVIVVFDLIAVILWSWTLFADPRQGTFLNDIQWHVALVLVLVALACAGFIVLERLRDQWHHTGPRCLTVASMVLLLPLAWYVMALIGALSFAGLPAD